MVSNRDLTAPNVDSGSFDTCTSRTQVSYAVATIDSIVQRLCLWELVPGQVEGSPGVCDAELTTFKVKSSEWKTTRPHARHHTYLVKGYNDVMLVCLVR